VAEAELEQATVDLQQAQSRYDGVADRPDIGMLPEAEALQQATLAYARAKAAYDRAVEQVGQHTYDVRSQQKRVALVRLEVKRWPLPWSPTSVVPSAWPKPSS
jgi:multidrug resistance efflux pump